VLTFSMLYCFTENFMLPFSHDEVVHGKQSMLNKMPGDEWQRHANLRTLYAYQFTHPGKKLLFMGTDIGDPNEWNHDAAVPWDLLQYPMHFGLQLFVRDLNRLYRSHPALYQVDYDFRGFEWIDIADSEKSCISFLRRAADPADCVIFACNFTPVPRLSYSVGVPVAGFYQEILNSDSEHYGGSNMGNGGGVMASDTHSHGRPNTISITLPPLAVVAFQCPRP
jgi:1,4-alpha-glucan branching enzyme